MTDPSSHDPTVPAPPRDVDAERVAALLDGHLDERAREALLGELAASDESLTALGDLAMVMAELERTGAMALAPSAAAPALHVARVEPVARVPDADAVVRPDAAPRPRPHDSRWRGARGWGLLAAAAVLVVSVGLAVRGRREATAPARPAALIALLDVADARDRTLPPPVDWRLLRGAATADADGGAHAARLGARLVDLQRAVAERDSGAALRAREVAAELDGVPGGAAAAGIYRELAAQLEGGGTAPASRLTLGWEASEALLDGEALRQGAWLQAARLAAARHDAAFFRADVSRRAVDRLAGSPVPTLATQGAQVRALVARANAADVDWAATARALEAALLALDAAAVPPASRVAP